MEMAMADERGARQGDEVLEAIDALTDAVEANSDDEKLLTQRLDELRRERERGVPVTQALADEDNPGTMQVLGRVLSRLMDASGNVRRALARSMRSEGTSIPAIARIFGVTHQRVSNILNRPPAVPAPVLHDVGTPGRGAGQGVSGDGPGAAGPQHIGFSHRPDPLRT
ncbi:MAG: hypothetical protein KGJ77_07205 [Acidobacteriota bacterium]|nr:hypothetical protein [Acidobacteriota bacterium]